MKIKKAELYKVIENKYLPNDKIEIMDFENCEMYEENQNIFLETDEKAIDYHTLYNYLDKKVFLNVSRNGVERPSVIPVKFKRDANFSVRKVTRLEFEVQEPCITPIS
ncbi:hypothetical protein ACEPP6_08730 [Bacillus rugosus]|uniref:hypothetical protein n=1 Tax=Bacillus rugosus TaxID=2715209 RepID=UPI0035A300FE